MAPIKEARKLALSFQGSAELPHFHLASFRIKKKIFATLWEKEKRMMVKLSLIDQNVFCAYDKTIIYPVPNKWGKQGATFIELQKVKLSLLKDAMTCAYKLVAGNKKLKAK